MDIRGITKFSLEDYPGMMSCIIFAGKCNFRCPYCHNPHLVLHHENLPYISETEIFDFLDSRRGKLDGVVISGGEPAIYEDLPDFARQIKEKGFSVKIDTNGSFPERIIKMCESGLVDMLGLDYKAPADMYAEVTGSSLSGLAGRVHKLIDYAVRHGVPCDVRTTVHRRFHSPAVLGRMRSELDMLGVGCWHLQQFHPVEVIDDSLLAEETYSDREIMQLARELGSGTMVRGISVPAV
jgi:pyruvate formate lyase activating enzyme